MLNLDNTTIQSLAQPDRFHITLGREKSRPNVEENFLSGAFFATIKKNGKKRSDCRLNYFIAHN